MIDPRTTTSSTTSREMEEGKKDVGRTKRGFQALYLGDLKEQTVRDGLEVAAGDPPSNRVPG